MRKKPGISSVVKEPYDVAGYFKGILDFAAKLIPDEEHYNTPIFAFATAGLRSLAESQRERIFDDDDLDNDHMLDADDDDFNKGKIAKTLSAMRQLFHNSTFYFHDSNVKILTGEEEATYDWISLQQMLHNGRKNMTKDNSVSINSGPPHGGKFPMGIIDTGGVSSQIGFVPADPLEGNIRIDTFGEETSFFAKSFLNFGMYESRAILESNIIRKCLKNKCETVYNPCFLVNNMQHADYGNVRYELHGTGNFDECYAEVLELFTDSSSDCPPNSSFNDRCIMESTILPVPSRGTKFIAIDNANRAARFFGFQGYTRLADVKKKVQEYCAMTWEEAQDTFTPETTTFRLRRYCYEGVYLLVLFHEGYRFPLDSDEIAFSDYIGGDHLNWALGAMSHQIHQMCKLGALPSGI